MCIHKKELTELDIYHRILRFKNYMVAMIDHWRGNANKSETRDEVAQLFQYKAVSGAVIGTGSCVSELALV